MAHIMMADPSDKVIPVRYAPIRAQAERTLQQTYLIRGAIHIVLNLKKRGVMLTTLHKPRESGDVPRGRRNK